MPTLEQQIKEAEAGAAELRRLQEAAEALPELQAQRAQEEKQRRATAALEQATAQAQRARAEYIERAAAFAPEFARLVDDARALAGKLAEWQRPIPVAAQQLAGAIAQAQWAGVPTAKAAPAWVALGWDRVPEVLPRGPGTLGHMPPLDERLAAALAWAAGVNVYVPAKGIRGAGVKA